jgi:calcineurin-like phosphoesterase
VNLIGRVFLESGADSPFAVADRLLETVRAQAKVVLVDFHAEASSEKRAMAFHVDGRASALWGTHTHVPTADEEILPGGLAYVSDVGMTGPYASVIGLDPVPATRKFTSGLPSPYRLAEGNPQLRALLVEVDDQSGRATEVRRILKRP